MSDYLTLQASGSSTIALGSPREAVSDMLAAKVEHVVPRLGVGRRGDQRWLNALPQGLRLCRLILRLR